MATHCVVIGCNKKADKKKGVSIHRCPLDKKYRDKWKRFLRVHGQEYKPKDNEQFGICSVHFKNEWFSRAFHVEGYRRTLKEGAFPSIWDPTSQNENISQRSRRQVRTFL